MAKSKDSFMDLVQQHEREWGTRSYTGRPSLEAILDAPVVTFWRSSAEGDQPPFTIKLYPDLQEVEKYLARLIFRPDLNPPKESLVRIYANRKRITVRGVQIQFQEVTDNG